jgi:hypothetical protein
MRLTARWAVALVAADALPALEARAAGALAVSSARAVFADRMASGLLTGGTLPSSLAPALSGARAPAVARAVGRAERRLALRAAPAVEARAACLRAAAVAVAPESRAADEIERVRVSLWHSAAGAIPAVEALALARRHARAVARAPALALRLDAVVTAPSVRARALARRRAVATSSTRTRDFDFLRPKLADSFPKPSNQRCPSPFDKTRGGTTQ